MLYKDFRKGFQLFTGVNTTCGVAGTAEKKSPGFWGDGCLKLCRRDLEITFHGGFQDHGDPFGEVDQIHICYPVGGRNDHLISFIDHHLNHIGKGMFGPVGNHNLSRQIIKAILPLQLAGNGILQFRIPRYG